MSMLNSRLSKVAAGLAVASAFAVAPVASQAADTDATGTLTAGGLTNTAPVITPFGVTLTGFPQGVNTAVGAWSVTDATGSNDGYSVTVAASNPTVGGVEAAAGTGGSLTLTPKDATPADGNPRTVGPQATAAQVLTEGGVTIQNADPGTGQGEWDFAADASLEKSLSVVIPADASAGAYSSTLTFTAAPAV
ncbi:MAG: hypothetical protein QOG15_1768 [Solirubrobacteraceae bacterium]|jgi:hypothetical protein|nr:hypothetical protein [Solirubrobacteraceae bacterium]